ncbi:MAG: hypothetical protein ACRDT7_11420 [Microbacterium sp.]
MLSQVLTVEDAESIRSVVPRSRYRTYTAATPSRILEAAQLYVLDAQARGALLELVHFAEVGVRDAIHQELRSAYGPHWFKGRTVILDDRTRARFREVEEMMDWNGSSPERVIAEVSFGAWTALLEVGAASDGSHGALAGRADYERDLWDGRLENVFSGITADRFAAAALMRRVQRLRNRVAHHESVVFGVHQHGEKDSKNNYRRQEPLSALRDVRSLLDHFCLNGSAWLLTCRHTDELLTQQLATDALAHAKATRKQTIWF